MSAPTSDPRDSASPFGVLDFLSWDSEKFHWHYRPSEIERSIALMKEAGVGFVRFDFLWEDIEPAKDRFEFEKYDRIVDLLTKYGIRVLALLAYNPPWTGRAWNDAPDTVRFGQYASAVVQRYRDRVRHWQIWHEPDSPSFWQPQDQLEAYVVLLKHVYPLLKSVDPTCIVHLAGLARSLPGSLKQIYEKQGKAFFDVVDIHPFANPLSANALGAIRMLYQMIRRVMESYGDAGKPMWFTEIGCPGVPERATVANWWLGKNPDEKAQAAWIETVYTEALRWPGVEKIFWCFFRDTVEHFRSGSDFDGLVRHDFTPKLSFTAFRDAARRFADNNTPTAR